MLIQLPFPLNSYGYTKYYLCYRTNCGDPEKCDVVVDESSSSSPSSSSYSTTSSTASTSSGQQDSSSSSSSSRRNFSDDVLSLMSLPVDPKVQKMLWKMIKLFVWWGEAKTIIFLMFFIFYMMNFSTNLWLFVVLVLTKKVNEFCDEHTHVRTTPTKHNFLCDGKSVWEVMREHPDFKYGSSSTIHTATSNKGTTTRSVISAPPPSFSFVTAKTSRVIFLLDRTQSMNQNVRKIRQEIYIFPTFSYNGCNLLMSLCKNVICMFLS